MQDKKVGIITQARTTSTRLPKKVLLNAGGRSVLEYHIDRLKQSAYPVYVATTTNEDDDSIVNLCEKLGVQYHRGSEPDVLSRFYDCAKKYELEIIVRVTSDCPLIDGELVKAGIEKMQLMTENTYLSNCIDRTYPRGFDFEIFPFSALEKAYLEATEEFEREHVTPFIRNPEKNKGVNMVHVKRDKDASAYRLTLDEVDDWALIKKMIEEFHADQKNANAIIEILDKNQMLNLINSHVEQKKVQ